MPDLNKLLHKEQEIVKNIREYILAKNCWVEIYEIANFLGVDRHDKLFESTKNSSIAQIINNYLKNDGIQSYRINFEKGYSIWVAPTGLDIADIPKAAFKKSKKKPVEKVEKVENKIKSEYFKSKTSNETINLDEIFKEAEDNFIVRDFDDTSVNESFKTISVSGNYSKNCRKFTANYSYSNSNFVIQNLDKEYVNSVFYPTICVLKNILQRGTPTLMSSYLQEEIGAIHKQKDFRKSYPLIDNQLPVWKWTIKGNREKDHYPAKDFFYKCIPTDLADCSFIQNLLIPEVAINEIVQDNSSRANRFTNQYVDFYLPQAKIVIEIDGKQHIEREQLAKDNIRDQYLLEHHIETIRITTDEMLKKDNKYKEKLNKIRKKLAELYYQQIEKSNPTDIRIDQYKQHYLKGTDLNNPYYLATAILRFQILILELLATEKLKFDKAWNLEILNRDIQGFVEVAIDDLFKWFDHLFILRNIIIDRPTININYVGDISKFSNTDSIKIDFSLLKRYTDENIDNPNIIYVRTDYYDDFDYFKISTAQIIDYPKSIEQYEESLIYLAWNLFLQSYDNLSFNNIAFREGQFDIITNALTRRHTIGLLPTGSGKSICYQLSCILQPAISFVVCPIKSLMIDQELDLKKAKIHRTKALTSDNSTEEKEIIQQEFKQGKYFFIFISPERFQIQKFRDYLTEINNQFKIAYAVIDEAHCLSEWGHDFRTSYLNLVNAIKRYCKDFKFIALTATASSNVLKDIKIELELDKDDDIKTPKKYTREELTFVVRDTSYSNKYQELKDLIKSYKQDEFFKDKCGVTFTAAVNGHSGCYNLSKDLTNDLNEPVDFYSGQEPKYYEYSLLFNEYKQKVQKVFKESTGTVLVTTKAFGMGVNKGNIGYTVHYGIPASMESLYQEAGRAGRAKTLFNEHKAECNVLFSKELVPQYKLDTLWDKSTSLEEINDIKKELKADISTQLFFLTISEKDIETEIETLKLLFNFIKEANSKRVLIENPYKFGNGDVEKSIFKLKQIGVVTDWTVIFLGDTYCQYLLEIGETSEDVIRDTVEKSISKYDNEFSIKALINSDFKYKHLAEIYNNSEISYFEKYARILLQWNYDTFFYSRRQSLKNVYEACLKVIDGELNSEEFKNVIENYFRFSNKSHIMQVIADNPLAEYQKWFDILYVFEDSVKTEETIKPKEVNNLISNLNRFLESYQQNTGLDFISGMLRLIANDFNNIDGRKRFVSSLHEIKKQCPIEHQRNIFKNLFKAVKNLRLSKDKKNELAKSIASVYDNQKEILFDLYKNLEDDYSLSLISKDFLNRIKNIKTKIEVGNE